MSTINGTNNGDGTWTAQLPATDPGTYDVIVTATKDGETATASATLTVTASAATVTIDALTTTNESPALTGTIDDPDASVTVTLTVNGTPADYEAVNDGEGAWSIAAGVLPFLDPGEYTVNVVAENAAGNTDASSATLTITNSSTDTPAKSLTFDGAENSYLYMPSGTKWGELTPGEGAATTIGFFMRPDENAPVRDLGILCSEFPYAGTMEVFYNNEDQYLNVTFVNASNKNVGLYALVPRSSTARAIFIELSGTTLSVYKADEGVDTPVELLTSKSVDDPLLYSYSTRVGSLRDGEGLFVGDLAQVFYVANVLTEEQKLAYAHGTQLGEIIDLSGPKQSLYKLNGVGDYYDYGGRAAHLVATEGATFADGEGPENLADNGEDPVGAAPPPDSGSDTSGMTLISQATLVEGATGDPVRVTATQQFDAEDENGNVSTTYTEWPAVEVAPGNINRIQGEEGDFSWITVNLIPEGGVTVGNDICNTRRDVVLSNLLVEAPDGTVLFDDALTIYPRTHTRPWWYIEQTPVADPDLSMLPYYPASNVSQASWYDSKTGVLDSAGADLNGPMGSGIIRTDTGGTGTHPGIGPVPQWDAPYLANPTADNARVMRGMADAFATYPGHARDPETLKLVSITKWPTASVYHKMSDSQNPFEWLAQTSSPYSMTQETAHMPGFCIASSVIFRTSYDLEELAMAANYAALEADPGNGTNYRRRAQGMLWNGQTRAKGWGIRNVAAAAALNAEWSEYFGGWLDNTLAYVKANYGPDSSPFDVEDVTWQSNSPHYRHVSIYMNYYLITGIGMAVQMGHTDWQYAMDLFGQLPVQAMLDKPHEMAAGYHYMGKASDGTYPADWAGIIDLSVSEGTGDAILSPQINDYEEDSLELIQVLKASDPSISRYEAGDFKGTPWSPDAPTSYLRTALAFAYMHGVDRAQSAWEKYLSYERIEWNNTMHYRVLPAPESD